MSEYPPPNESYTQYNPANFSEASGGGITQTQGDSRYVKLAGSISTGLQTFNSGFLVPSSFQSSSSSNVFSKAITVSNLGSGGNQIILQRPSGATGFIARNQDYSTVTNFNSGTVNDYLIASTSGGANLVLSGGDSGQIAYVPGSVTLNQNIRTYGSNGTNLILNKQVTTSGTNCINLQLSSGSASAPNYSFIGSTNNGFYLSSTNTLGFSTNGTLRFSISTANLISTLPILNPVGLVSAPGMSFSGFTSTGFYMNASDLSVARSGVNVQSWTSTINNFIGEIRSYLSAPDSSYTISTDKDVFSFTTSLATITLPAATSSRGRTLIINNGSAGNITIQRTSTDVIGSSGVTSITLATNRSVRMTAVTSSRWSYWTDV